MPNFTVVKGRIANHGHIYETGDRITLDEDQAEPLLANGMLEPVRKGRPPATKGRKATHDADDGDEGEGGDD